MKDMFRYDPKRHVITKNSVQNLKRQSDFSLPSAPAAGLRTPCASPGAPWLLLPFPASYTEQDTTLISKFLKYHGISGGGGHPDVLQVSQIRDTYIRGAEPKGAAPEARRRKYHNHTFYFWQSGLDLSLDLSYAIWQHHDSHH